jgi:hypothetical protein
VANDLGQFIIDENPYGYDTSGELNSSIDVIRGELASLRTTPGADVKHFHHIAGPAARANDDDPAPDVSGDYAKLMDGLFWFFRGKQYRISKAMRLQYKVGGKTYHILVGYEGSGGGM